MSVDAELIFGISVTQYDADYEPTPLYESLWSEKDEDWRDFEEEAAVAAGAVNPWGLVPEEIANDPWPHENYERWKSENDFNAKLKVWHAAKREAASGVRFELRHYGHYDDPDGPRAILTPKDIDTIRGSAWEPGVIQSPDDLLVTDKTISKATESARSFGIDVDFNDARWLLVASYG